MGVLDTDLDGPTMANVLGVRGQRLRLSAEELHPAEGLWGLRSSPCDLCLRQDRVPLLWKALTQQDAFRPHTTPRMPIFIVRLYQARHDLGAESMRLVRSDHRIESNAPGSKATRTVKVPSNVGVRNRSD